MKITILTLTFPPEPAQHILELAASLVRDGHQVDVVTSLPSYPFGRIYPAYRRKWFAAERWSGIRIFRLPVIPSHSSSLVKRGLYYFTNALSILVFLVLNPPRWSGVAIAYLPPLSIALPLLFLRPLKRMKFVAWIHDMWPETLEEAGLKNKRILSAIDRVAKHIYRKAAHVIVLSKGFKANLIGKGVPPDKISVIPNWADLETRPIRAAGAEDCARFGLPADRFNVLYAGNLGEMQDLEAVIHAFSWLEAEPDIMLLFLGSGIRQDGLMQLVKEKAWGDRIQFLGRVPPRDVPEYYALADVLLVHIRDTKLFQITIPHKIYEYMASAKPVIAAVKGDAREEILRAGAGIACEPGNSESIAAAILDMKRRSPAARAEMGMRGRRFLEKHRSPGVLTNEFKHLLEIVHPR